MSRRLLGPIGGPVTFFLIAALVFAGLGWVTVVALRVEQAQREAAAQAELGNNLRVALWRLDGRMLPALGVEDSRPFYHYNSADPLSVSTTGPTPTPLLAAPLPDWMKLHVQLDPVAGWESPQVLSPEACARVTEAWPDLPLRNSTVDRAAVLTDLKGKYPAVGTCEVLAARDRATPADDRPFAAPLFDPQSPAAVPVVLVPLTDATPKPPPPADVGRAPLERAPEPFRLFGWDMSRPDAVASNSRDNNQQAATPMPNPVPPAAPVASAPKPPAYPPNPPPLSGTAGRAGNYAQLSDNEFQKRSQTIQRGVQEAKNAGLEFPMYGNNRAPGPYQQGLNPAGDGKTNPGNGLTQLVAPPNAGQTQATSPGAPGIGGDKVEKDAKGGVPGGKPGEAPIDPSFDKLHKDVAKAKDVLKSLLTEQPRGTLTEHLCELAQSLDRRCLDDLQQSDQRPAVAAAWAVAFAAAGNPHAPRLVPPAEERPLPNFNNFNNNFNNGLQNTTNNLQNNALVGPPVVNIHLGSMRPQWITAADGTETLVLVRTAKLDNRTVYQGVILDWPKLEAVLKDEVKDLFPDAALVPVKDASGVSPDRAMTALPVQLDPGPQPELPRAGWTTLRVGLVLVWVAALIAFAAVGLSGWSLVDLAERRIRFVSAVTHELRTPLTSLRLYIDLLMSGMIQDEAKRQEYLNTLATESDRLHRLIDNVLDFAKLEKRRANGEMKPVKVSELLDQLQKTWTDRVGADGKELVVISTLPPEAEVITDAVMVHQIVGNLIDNARKYTRDADDKRIWLWAKPGGTAHPTPEAAAQTRGVGSSKVVFEVEDRGAGVPASERKLIFKPFRRGAQAETTAGGAGLGLALAKQWAEVLGGTLAFRPAEGAPGACFRLELPTK